MANPPQTSEAPAPLTVSPQTGHKLLALSVQQPWAELLISGLKDVENRLWHTRYRGPLLIHASKMFDREWKTKLRPSLANYVQRHLVTRNIARLGHNSFPVGALIGFLNLYDILNVDKPKTLIKPPSASEWAENYAFHFAVSHPHRFRRPAKFTGALKLFDVPNLADLILPQDSQDLHTFLKEFPIYHV